MKTLGNKKKYLYLRDYMYAEIFCFFGICITYSLSDCITNWYSICFISTNVPRLYPVGNIAVDVWLLIRLKQELF